MWDNKELYDIEAKKLANMFVKNYEKYKDKKFTDYSNFGPKIN